MEIKFLIVNDVKEERQQQKSWLDIYDSIFTIEEYEDTISALQRIENGSETDCHFIIIADGYMPPNSDGNTVLDEGKLFGGLWLIDQVNKSGFKEYVTIILVTYYTNERVKNYRNGNEQKLFPWLENKDYYFVNKDFSEKGKQIFIKKLKEAIKRKK